jgi:acetolactate synthase-1/2/3 large subunit
MEHAYHFRPLQPTTIYFPSNADRRNSRMTKMTGYKYVAEAIKAHGISHLFFVPTIMIPTMAELEDNGVTRVTCHDEKAAAYMADGYARAAHRPGICLAQNVGSMNLAAGLRDGRMAGAPIIAITGGADTAFRYRHVYQEVEDFPVFEPVTKMSVEVDHVKLLPNLLRQAFRTATTGSPGPVHLRMRGRHGNVLEEEGEFELAFEERFSRYPAFRPEPELPDIKEAIEKLVQAERPIIVAGGGVIRSQAEPELVALAEKLSLPVVTSLNGKAAIRETHPLSVGVCGTYSRWCANRAVAQADLVFFIASHTGSQVTHNWRIPKPTTPIIQLDIEPEELGRSYPAVVSLAGDAKATLRRMAESIKEPVVRPQWVAAVQRLKQEWAADVKSALDSDDVPMRPERICNEITEVLPTDAVLVADTGQAAFWTGTMVGLKHETQSYIRCAGSLGWAFPASLGVKCALPDRPVLCFTGDGGFYYHISELETAARFGINTVVLVNNNHSLGQEQRLFNAAYGGSQRGQAHTMWMFKETNFAMIAEAAGCVGIRVERPSELSAALKMAFSCGRPAVIDVVSDYRVLHPRAWTE